MSATFTLTESPQTKTLKVSGHIAGKVNEQFKTELLSLLQATVPMELCLRETVSMDLSSIQLIQGLREAADRGRKGLNIVPPADGELSRLLNITGLMTILTNTK